MTRSIAELDPDLLAEAGVIRLSAYETDHLFDVLTSEPLVGLEEHTSYHSQIMMRLGQIDEGAAAMFNAMFAEAATRVDLNYPDHTSVVLRPGSDARYGTGWHHDGFIAAVIVNKVSTLIGIDTDDPARYLNQDVSWMGKEVRAEHRFKSVPGELMLIHGRLPHLKDDAAHVPERWMLRWQLGDYPERWPA